MREVVGSMMSVNPMYHEVLGGDLLGIVSPGNQYRNLKFTRESFVPFRESLLPS